MKRAVLFFSVFESICKIWYHLVLWPFKYAYALEMRFVIRWLVENSVLGCNGFE